MTMTIPSLPSTHPLPRMRPAIPNVPVARAGGDIIIADPARERFVVMEDVDVEGSIGRYAGAEDADA